MPDATPAPLSRRAVVAGAGALGAGLAVAGCASVPVASGGSATNSAPGTALGPAADVPVGSARIYRDQGVVVTRAAAGGFAGFSTACPHQGCAVSVVEGASLLCPCHGSRFALDGSVTQGPAARGLEPRAVAVTDGEITLA